MADEVKPNPRNVAILLEKLEEKAEADRKAAVAASTKAMLCEPDDGYREPPAVEPWSFASVVKSICYAVGFLAPLPLSGYLPKAAQIPFALGVPLLTVILFGVIEGPAWKQRRSARS